MAPQLATPKDVTKDVDHQGDRAVPLLCQRLKYHSTIAAFSQAIVNQIVSSSDKANPGRIKRSDVFNSKPSACRKPIWIDKAMEQMHVSIRCC
jgi:hypothetical protein